MTDISKLNSYFDKDTHLKGSIKFKGIIRFDGQFDGEVISDDTFIVGETGRINAKINTGTLFNFGIIEGDVETTRKVLLFNNSILKGDITTPRLVTEEKAMLEGKCSMPQPDMDVEPEELDLDDIVNRKHAIKPTDPAVVENIVELSVPETASGSRGGKKILWVSLVILAILAAWLFVSGGLGKLSQNISGITKDKAPIALVSTDNKPAVEVGSELNDVADIEPLVNDTSQAEPIDTIEREARGVADDELMSDDAPQEVETEFSSLSIAQKFIDEKNYSGAITSLEESVANFPESDELIMTLAMTLQHVGQESRARGLFRKLAKTDPGSIEARNNEAYVQMDLGYLHKAESSFLLLLEEEPDNLRARLGLAEIYSKLNQNDKATEHCKAILARFDDYAPALNRQAWVFGKQEINLNEAEEMSLKSLAVYNDIPDYLDTLSEIKFKQGEYDEAIRIISDALEVSPQNSYYKRQLNKFKQARNLAG